MLRITNISYCRCKLFLFWGQLQLEISKLFIFCRRMVNSLQAVRLRWKTN